MRLLYRLQQRMALTGSECTALVVLVAVFLTGLAARHLLQRTQPFPPDAYAETDRQFEAASRAIAEPQVAPSEGPPETPPRAASPRVDLPRVDLNAATESDLTALPRIGPKTAARILDYRARRGRFRSVDDLLHVPGIGEKTLAVLRPHLHVSADSAEKEKSAMDK